MALTNREVLKEYSRSKNKTAFVKWLCSKVPDASKVNKATLISRMLSLKKVKTKLSKHMQHDELENVMQDKYDPNVSLTSMLQSSPDPEGSKQCTKRSPLTSIQNSTPTSSKKPRVNFFQQDVNTVVNAELARENALLSEQNENLKSSNMKMQARLKAFNVSAKNQSKKRNERIIAAKKGKIKALENKLKNEKKSLKHFERSIRTLQKEKEISDTKLKKIEIANKAKCLLVKAIRARTERTCTKFSELKKKNKDFEQVLSNRKSVEVQKLDKKVKELSSQIAYMESFGEGSDESKVIDGKENGKFTREVRLVVYKLLGHNVGVAHVSPVIDFCLETLGNINLQNRPSKSEVAVMQREVGILSKVCAAENLKDEANLCIQTDGTEDRGTKLATMQVKSSSQTFDVGLKEIVAGTSDEYYNFILRSLGELEETYDKVMDTPGSNILKKIVVNIKCAMNDRHVVEKNTMDQFTQYRKTFLPEMVEKWEKLTDVEKDDAATVYLFYCALHLLVAMATEADKALAEMQAGDDQGLFKARRGESDTTVFIRSMCNFFYKAGSGHPLEIQSFVKKEGISKIPLTEFKGSRFNILFYNGAGSFELSTVVLDYLQTVRPPQEGHNKLDAMLYYDLTKRPHIVANCRALGLIDKLVTAPLWRKINKVRCALDMGPVYKTLLDKLSSLSVDPAPLLDGSLCLFEGIPIHRDPTFSSLVCPSNDDGMCSEALRNICGRMEKKLSPMLADFLPGGKYFTPTAAMKSATVNCPATNMSSEESFGRAKQLMTHTPAANIGFIESKALAQKNKPIPWLMGKPISEQELILKNVIKVAREQVKMETSEKRKLEKARQDRLSEKQLATEEKIKRKARAKQLLLANVEDIGGLWVTSEQMDEQLNHLGKVAKKNAIKCQINVRKKVLEQPGDKSLFVFSREKKQLSEEELTKNLKQLMTMMPPPDSVTHDVANDPTILVGRKITHIWFNSDVEEEELYYGEIIQFIPDTQEFEIKYTGFTSSFFVSLGEIQLDMEAGDLDLISDQ